MKLSLRFPLIVVTIFAIYLVFQTHFEDEKQARPTQRVKFIDNKIKRLRYNQHKKIINTRLRALVIRQNISLTKKPTRKKKPQKDIDNGNYRLKRLLYQMWEPNKNDDQSNLLNCDNLISADDKKYRQGRRFARKLNRKFYEYVNVSEIWETIRYSCVSVLNVFKYRKPKFSAAAYPLAYTITLDRTAEQSLRLMASIYNHDNVYCVHPNAKFGTVYLNVFKKLSECIPNIVLPDKIYGIRVKTYNRLRAQLSCFKKLLNSSVPWKYGINLPSSAFPLRNNTYIVQYLKHKPYENIVSWEVPNNRFEKRYKYSYVLKEIEGETVLLRTTIQKKPPPGAIKIFRKGEHFVSIRQFWEFLTGSEIANTFLEWARDTKNPEDFFYASLNRHVDAPGGFIYDENSYVQEVMQQTTETENVSDIPPSDLLVNLWKSDHSVRCHGVYRGFMCIYGSADLRWLLQQDSLFAFSFDFRVDRVAVDCLTKHLKNSILQEYREQADVSLF